MLGNFKPALIPLTLSVLLNFGERKDLLETQIMACHSTTYLHHFIPLSIKKIGPMWPGTCLTFPTQPHICPFLPYLSPTHQVVPGLCTCCSCFGKYPCPSFFPSGLGSSDSSRKSSPELPVPNSICQITHQFRVCTATPP